MRDIVCPGRANVSSSLDDNAGGREPLVGDEGGTKDGSQAKIPYTCWQRGMEEQHRIHRPQSNVG